MRISDFGLMELSGMEFHAYHGCLETEKSEGNLFTVDFKAEVPVKRAVATDMLNETVDMKEIYEVIRREMETPSDLLEHVAGRIVLALKKEFPLLGYTEVTVSKRNPPVGGICAWSRITVRSNDRP